MSIANNHSKAIFLENITHFMKVMRIYGETNMFISSLGVSTGYTTPSGGYPLRKVSSITSMDESSGLDRGESIFAMLVKHETFIQRETIRTW